MLTRDALARWAVLHGVELGLLEGVLVMTVKSLRPRSPRAEAGGRARTAWYIHATHPAGKYIEPAAFAPEQLFPVTLDDLEMDRHLLVDRDSGWTCREDKLLLWPGTEAL